MRIIFLLAMLCPFLSMCQPITIKGKVIDEQNTPVAGATISLKRQSANDMPLDIIFQTTSNTGGEFTIHNSLLTDTLIVSAVGYHTQHVPNNERGLITVILKRRTSALDDVVIIAYGTTTRRFNTGNVSSISAADIERQPVSNPLATLQGRIPGLIVTQTSGVAGSAFNIELRGRTSLDLSLSRNDPLIIIDGVPFESGNLPVNQLSSAVENPYKVSGVFAGGLSPLHSINPQDIESIDVLKDADATSIYGSRGANGVILITTKKAITGRAKFSINLNSGISKAQYRTDFLNTAQYLAMRREAFAQDAVVPTNATAPDILLWDTTRYTNFQKLLTGNTAHASNIQASLSGGTAGTNFLLSGGMHRETDVFPGSFRDVRSSLQLTVVHSPLSRRWSTRLSALYSVDNNQLPRTDLTKYISLPPNIRVYTPDSKLSWQEAGVNYQSLGFSNPMSELEKKYTSVNRNLLSNFQIAYNLFTGFTLRTSAGYNIFSNDETSINPRSSIAPQSSLMASSLFADAARTSWILEPQAEYQLTRASSKWQLLAGTTFQERKYHGSFVTASNYTNDLLLGSLNAAGSIEASNNSELYRYSALFGRITYNYQNKYLINLSGRRDGSSRFAPGRQFATFGAVGGAWIFTSEEWLGSNSFISFGKLRGSFGVTGNDQIGDYKYLDLWSSTSNAYQGIPGLRPSFLFNPVYQWEKNKKLELAIELSLLKDRISFNSSWYQNKSSNQLVSYRLPGITGFTSVVKNLPALVQNTGVEFVTDGNIFYGKNFSWRSSFNITFPKNRLVSFPGLAQSSYSSVYEEGQSLSVIKRAKYAGVDPLTGLYTYKDLNSDGTLSAADNQILGNLDPKFYGGFSNAVTYKGFQVAFFFHFTKRQGSNYLAAQYGTPAGFLVNQPTIVLNRWQKPGDAALVQRFGATAASAVFLPSYYLQATDAIFSDASFIRLKNVSAAYNFQQRLLAKANAQAAKIYLQAQNLFTITNYLGADPETQNFYQLPPLKTIVLGFQITF